MTRTERVCRALQSDIIAGNLRPGSRLIRRDIAKRLGVSTIPVMEAIQSLERTGLVDLKPRGSARVVGLTEEGLQNDLVLREALESQAARLCAERATQEQIADLYYQAGRLDEMMSKGGRRSPEGIQAHMQFHLSVARYTGFRLLKEELEHVWLRRMLVFTWVSSSLKPIPPNWHYDFVKVISQRDPEAADAKAREHTRFGRENLTETLRRIAAENELKE